MCADYFLHMLQGTHFTYNRMGFFTAYYFASIIFNIVVIFYKGPSIYHVDKFSPLFAPPPPQPLVDSGVILANIPPLPHSVHVDIFYENIDIIGLQKQRGQ